MELKEFVSESLKQVIEGVMIAQTFAKEHGAQINPIGRTPIKLTSGAQTGYSFPVEQQVIEFDIALTTSESDRTKGGIGVFVAGIGLGTQAEISSQDNTISRIKFSVPIYLPAQQSGNG